MRRYIEQFKNMSPVAKTSLVLIIAKFLQKGLAFISNPIFTRIMPSSEYGVISTFSSWQTIVYIILTLNMASGVFNNGMLEFKDDRDGFTFSILTLANSITVFFVGVYFLFKGWLQPFFDMPDILMLLLLLYCFFSPAYDYWLGRNRFEYKYKSIFIVTALTSILSTVAAILLVLVSPDDQKAIAKVSATEGVAILTGVAFYIYMMIKGRKRFQFKYWKYALAINLPLIPHYLSMYILSSSDRIMITKLVNTSATAIYNVAYSVAAVVLIFWNAVDAAYAPWIYQKMEVKDYKALQRRAQEVILLFAGCAIFVTLFAPEIIRILGPEEYYEGVYIIPPVVAGVFFTAIFSLYMRVELYLKKSTTIMAATVGAALANLILNYIFIKSVGYWAAAYTTMVCYMLLAVFHAFNLKRLGYGDVYNNKMNALISVIVCVVIISLSVLYQHDIIRYALIAVMLILAVIYRKKLIGLVKKQKN